MKDLSTYIGGTLITDYIKEARTLKDLKDKTVNKIEVDDPNTHKLIEKVGDGVYDVDGYALKKEDWIQLRDIMESYGQGYTVQLNIHYYEDGKDEFLGSVYYRKVKGEYMYTSYIVRKGSPKNSPRLKFVEGGKGYIKEVFDKSNWYMFQMFMLRSFKKLLA